MGALLPLALSAMEAALRRTPDALGVPSLRSPEDYAHIVRPLRCHVLESLRLRYALRPCSCMASLLQLDEVAGAAGAPIADRNP